MGANYFTVEKSWKHLFFITGLTADEFYTDGGLRLNIEQLTHLELKRSGYERIVFYDSDNKLYCYDDESYALLRVNGSTRSEKETAGSDHSSSRPRRGRGLQRGRHAQRTSGPAQEAKPQGMDSEGESAGQPWKAGANSGVQIRNCVREQLYLGMTDNTFVKRQIDAYMHDARIKTAIVINDTPAFLEEFAHEPMHSFTVGYEKMNADNHNILVFLYPDQRLGHIYRTDSFEQGELDANLISILCPNAAELRNMLMYFRVNRGLKIRLRELPEAALALRKAMACSKRQIRIKEVYERLKQFGTERMLTADACYELLGAARPDSARSSLDQLIGMQKIKEALSAYDTNQETKTSVFAYLTASRLQPDRENPEQKEEMIHFVITGNPGTGKTTVARLIGQLFFEMGYLEDGHVTETDRSGLVGSHVGETAILTRQRVEEAMGGVLFIDEAYSLKRQRDTGNDFGQEAIDTLCKLMDQHKGRFITVAAGYQREMETFLASNPGLSSRFTLLHIDDYSPEEMCEILRFHARRNRAVFSEELNARLSDFCENWVSLSGEDWGNAREAEKLISSMMRIWKQSPEKKTKRQPDGTEYALLEEMPEALREYLRPVSEMRAEVLERLNQMPGLTGVKASVERLRKRMLAGDRKEPGHYLFTGNPGTGKTTVARYMGRILRNLGMLRRGHLIEYTASGLMSEMFNEENRGDFFSVAKKAVNGVLFIDEAYQLVSDTTGRGKAVLDALLPFMENYRSEICVIVAGYEEEMDDFLRSNPGYSSRFAEQIHFANYTGEELCGVLMNMLKEKGICADEEYRENALRALTRYVEIHGKEKDFGNARYVRSTFLPACLDAQTDRLIRLCGEDFPRELKKTLTGEDIPADLVRFTRTPLEKADDRSAMEKLDALIGYEEIKKELRRLLKAAEFNRTNEIGVSGMPERLHWVLEGNPGTGKSTIAGLIGQVYKECGILPNGRVHKVTRADLVAEYQGQTAIRTRRCIQKAMGGVLFIDEAYALTKVEHGGGGYGQEAITELVDAMETYNGEFAVVCAGYPEDMEDFLKANAGLSSRMKKFVLKDYTPEELAQIFRQKCEKEKAAIDEALLNRLPLFFFNKKHAESRLRDWGNGRETENLLRDMLHNWMEDEERPYFTDEQGRTRILLAQRHLPAGQERYLRGKLASQKKETSALDEINQLIGFEEVKKKLRDLLALGKTAKETGREDLLEDLNFHWVLRGNPGTGKTTIARLIGKVYKEIGLLEHGRTVKVTRTDLVSGYVGQTAQKTQRCIDRAMGGVLFIDEAYTLKRGHASENDFGQEAIDTLLEQMSDRNGLFAVIAAGYPGEMDVFLDSNPGFRSRFEDNFLLEDYTAEELMRIFEMKCQAKKFHLEPETRNLILRIFENMTAAKLRNWANGREAENLERRMRQLWGTRPVVRQEEESGETLCFYTADHIPDSYRKYIPEEQTPEAGGESSGKTGNGYKDKTGDEKKAAEREASSFLLPREKLLPLPEAFDYEKSYLEQAGSVVFIRGKTPEGISSGSGGMITSDGYILTCRHVIADCREIQVRIQSEQDGETRTSWEEASVVWQDGKLDAALLKIAGSVYPALALRPETADPQPGEDIYHWGYPFGDSISDNPEELRPSIFRGSISSLQTRNGLERIYTNMEAKRGCSGGPVFSKKDGSVIGILCGSQMMGTEQLVEELNFVLPVKYLWKLAVAPVQEEKTPQQADPDIKRTDRPASAGNPGNGDA